MVWTRRRKGEQRATGHAGRARLESFAVEPGGVVLALGGTHEAGSRWWLERELAAARAAGRACVVDLAEVDRLDASMVVALAGAAGRVVVVLPARDPARAAVEAAGLPGLVTCAATRGEALALLRQSSARASEPGGGGVVIEELPRAPRATSRPLAFELPASPQCLWLLRGRLHAWLADAGVEPEVAYELVLAASEAAAGVIDGAADDEVGAPIEVTARLAAGRVSVGVRSRAGGRNAQEADGSALRLAIVRALAGDVAVVERGSGSYVGIVRDVRPARRPDPVGPSRAAHRVPR